MYIEIKQEKLEQEKADILIVAIKEKEDGTFAIENNDIASVVSRLVDIRNLSLSSGNSYDFLCQNLAEYKAIIFVVYDNVKSFINATKKAITLCRKYKAKKVASLLHLASISSLSTNKKLSLIAQTMIDSDYCFTTFKSDKKDSSALLVSFLIDKSVDLKLCQKAVHKGVAIGLGINKAKDLGNTPSNVCTPKFLAKQAKVLAAQFASVEVDILKENEIEEHKMGAFLSVSKGSKESPRLIVIKHNGGKHDEQPIALVGKGVTFDSGGISLKPGPGMDEMKYDMCGAASVLGTMQVVAELNLPINVVAVIPAVENMPSGNASKPGDIVTSMSGKTIEILNTDAEGRLILCDSMTYAMKFNPKVMIDIATLTGAVIIALGNHPSGLMSNDDNLANKLINAGNKVGDRVWQLPLWDEYKEQLKSPFADLQNIGGREAGTITAGCFLSEFAECSWAHIDIAGTAWVGGKNKGATGRPVALLVEYIRSCIN